MKVLYYNWVDYLDAEKRGGGVTVYQANLMKRLQEQPGVEAWFLSAGISYDLFSSKPRWEKLRHGPSDDAPRYEIVNSGILSPAHMSFGNPAQVSHPETAEVFFDFVKAHGPFDVIHFNNLEGIPAEVLELKQQWPQTKVVLSLHNYYPFCPQVNLWQQEKIHCADFGGGRKCRSCLQKKPEERAVRLAGAVAYNLKKYGCGPGTRVFDRGFGTAVRVASRLVRAHGKLRRQASGQAAAAARTAVRLSPEAEFPINPSPAADFAVRRERFLELINRNCDHVLGVSERVSEIAREYGVNPELVSTAYIGTRQYGKFQETAPRPSLLDEDGVLTLGYLGYMRRDKGYFFLLDALNALPKDVAQRVRLVLAAPRGRTLEPLRELSGHLRDVVYSDGYSHDQLDELLAPVTLGVVPVLWEDNLPQVAIEMHARHIPLLTSSRGGARELGNCPDLVFEAGDEQAFAARIEAALEGRIDLDSYWANARPPVSMTQHTEALLELYRQAPARSQVQTAAQ
ncbi:glycosyltransferase [Leisingera daeponensis]|uniref:Glycosyltransferase n=1 Tax=Leisingera daeponensis TaxID=405746 RepID=A0ABS7NIF2_9RHOB|nr:glycosyltransferase [Leisingera daeponensis]MBY6140987.1 glycosyltransferase [Leisingera daeponensis]